MAENILGYHTGPHYCVQLVYVNRLKGGWLVTGGIRMECGNGQSGAGSTVAKGSAEGQ